MKKKTAKPPPPPATFILVPATGHDFSFQSCQYCVFTLVVIYVTLLLAYVVFLLFSTEGIVARALGY